MRHISRGETSNQMRAGYARRVDCIVDVSYTTTKLGCVGKERM